MPVRRGRAARAAAIAAAVGASALGASLGTSSVAAGHALPALDRSHAKAPQLTVLGAASLSLVFPKIDPAEQYTFNGSGTLETDIQQGAPADVYAAANPTDPEALYQAGLVYRPVAFATNTLVMIVPRDNPAGITSVSDITKPGVSIVVCDASQPCGDYASTVFANLGITTAADANIVSEQTDVTQVVAEIAAGQADVGFVYVTDAKAAGSKVKTIALPAQAMPGTEDYIAVVKSTTHLSAARAFVKLVLSKKGQKTLREAGFGKP